MKAAILTHNGGMQRLLIVGCGDVARRVIPLLAGRYRLYALVRSDRQNPWLRAHRVTPIRGDLDHRASLARITGLADVVLHLAPPPKLGNIDTCTRHLLSALSQGSLPRRIVYVSTSGVYGDCLGERISETHALNPQSPRAERRVDAERRIRSWSARNGVKSCILRVPGIYAQDRMPLDRLRVSMPVIIAEEDSYTNHIHGDDLARIMIAALRHGGPNRAYNASDDSELKMGDWLDAVADAHKLRRPPRVTRAEAQRMLPDTLLSFFNESRRLVNTRMKRELKLGLRYPTTGDALRGR